jgi:hypothetical protein
LILSGATLLPIIALLPGCTAVRVEQHVFDESLVDGVPIAANRGGPKHAGELFRYEQVLTLQQDPAHPGSLLHRYEVFPWDMPGFLMDERGFYVLDRRDYRIAAFDLSGHHVGSLGREGHGPGEFAGWIELIGLSDGVLQVYDAALHRTTYYRTDGALQGMVQIPTSGSAVYHLDTEGLLVSIKDTGEYRDQVLWTGTGFVAMTSDGDTVGYAKSAMVPLMFGFPWPSARGGVRYVDMPFANRPDGCYAGEDGVLLITGTEPVVWSYRVDGTLLRKITLDLPAWPVSEEDRDAWFANLDAQMTEADSRDREYRSRMRVAARFPETRAHWRDIMVDDTGCIWLEVCEMDYERREAQGSVRFDVLSPRGEYLGATRAPAMGRVWNGHFLGIVTDEETGREDYVVWRMVPQPDGFTYPAVSPSER